MSNQHNPVQTAGLATEQSANTYGVYSSEIAALQKGYAELWGRAKATFRGGGKIKKGAVAVASAPLIFYIGLTFSLTDVL